MKIGKRLHQIRQQRNISQAGIARTVGVSVGTIQGYEHGRTRITADRLEQLAAALQCEPIDLLAEPSSALPRYNQRRYRALLAKIRSANDEEQKRPPPVGDDPC